MTEQPEELPEPIPQTWRKYGAAFFVQMETIDRYGVTLEEIAADVNRKMEAEIREMVKADGFEIVRGPRFERDFEDGSILGKGYRLRALVLAKPRNE
jgi:hypothetical protein